MEKLQHSFGHMIKEEKPFIYSHKSKTHMETHVNHSVDNETGTQCTFHLRSIRLYVSVYILRPE